MSPSRKPGSRPAQTAEPETTVDLSDARKRRGGALPHEHDQQASAQAPAARQHRTPVSKSAFDDARRGRPDTSSAPLLQRPSPQDR